MSWTGSSCGLLANALIGASTATIASTTVLYRSDSRLLFDPTLESPRSLDFGGGGVGILARNGGFYEAEWLGAGWAHRHPGRVVHRDQAFAGDSFLLDAAPRGHRPPHRRRDLVRPAAQVAGLLTWRSPRRASRTRAGCTRWSDGLDMPSDRASGSRSSRSV